MRLTLVAIFALPAAAFAQAGSQSAGAGAGGARHASHSIPTPTAIASQRSGALVVDGRLDDAAWQGATPVTEFKQWDPEHGAAPT
jgi:hypothetical protein